MRLYGAYRRLFGVGRLRLDQPTAYGEPFDSAAADLRFEGTGVRLNGLDIRKGAGSATGAAFIEWDASYSFNLDARDIDVGTLEFLPALPRPPSGTVAGIASGAGFLDNPRYAVRATISDLRIGDEEVGHITGQLDVRDGEVRLDLEGASSTVAFSAAGRVSLAGAQEADLSLRVADWSLDPYVRMFVPEWSPYTKAVLSGSLDVVGELRNWDRLDATATIQRMDLSLLDYEIRNEGPIRLTLDRRVIGIDQLRLTGAGTALDLAGVVDLASDEVSVGVDGNANLDILQGMFQSLRGAGSAVVDAEVAGTVRQPVLTGQAAVRDGRIRHISLPHALERINGRIIFEGGAIRFDDMVASMGSGPVQLGGRAGVDGLQLGELGITASGRDMQLRFPEGFRSNVDTDLVLRGPPDRPVLAGTVDVRDAVLFDGLDAAGGLFGGGLFGGDARAEEPGLPLSFDVRIDAPSSLRIDNNLARIVSSAELTLQGTYDRPVLLGTVEIERGTAFFEGNRYRLNHGTIGFANLNRIELSSTSRSRPTCACRSDLSGDGPGDGHADELVPALSSDPPLPEVDVLSLLLGDTRDPQSADLRAARAPELAQQQRFQAGAARLLTSPLSSSVGRVVQDSFGVDTFQITPVAGRRPVLPAVGGAQPDGADAHRQADIRSDPRHALAGDQRRQPRSHRRSRARPERADDVDSVAERRSHLRAGFSREACILNRASIAGAVGAALALTAPAAADGLFGHDVCAGEEALALTAPAAAADPEALAGRTVAEVRFFRDGRPFDDPSLLDFIETRPGQPLSMRQVRESLTHLFSLGDVVDVRVSAAPAPQGVSLRYDLAPLRAAGGVEVLDVLGRPIEEAADLIRRRVGAAVSPERVAGVAALLGEYYRDAGRFAARITPRPPGADGRLVIDVDRDRGRASTESRFSGSGLPNAPRC